MKEAIEESNKKIQTWISQRHEKPKRWYSKEAYIYADEITDKIKKQMMNILSTLTLVLTGIQQITDVVKSNLVLKNQSNVDWSQITEEKNYNII